MAANAASSDVPLATFKHLFHAVADTLRRTPAQATLTQWERRLTVLGRDVGKRTVESLSPAVPRPTTPEAAGDFITNMMFPHWFAVQPAVNFRDEGGLYITQSVPFIDQHPNAAAPLDQQEHLGAFVAGMIMGALESGGFPCDVCALYVPPGDEDARPASMSGAPPLVTQYMITWAPCVRERLRRAAAAASIPVPKR